MAQIFRDTWENTPNAPGSSAWRAGGRNIFSTSSPPLLAESFSRHANITALSSCPCPEWSQLSVVGALEESLGQEGKTLGDCSLLNESNPARNCLSQPLDQRHGQGASKQDIGLEIWSHQCICKHIIFSWVGKRLNRRNTSLSHFKSNHLDNHPLYALVSLILT